MPGHASRQTKASSREMARNSTHKGDSVRVGHGGLFIGAAARFQAIYDEIQVELESQIIRFDEILMEVALDGGLEIRFGVVSVIRKMIATDEMNAQPLVIRKAKDSCLSPNKQIPLDGIMVIGGFLLICLLEVLAILLLNDGKFTYTLDDPYIHLAVAEELIRGHYGVNAVEVCAPCSSPLWPLLLAPFARTPISEFLPLGLNIAFGVLTCWVVLRGMRRVLPVDSDGGDWTQALARVVMAWVVLLGCNVPGLVFSGMEHSLQVLMAILVVDGMIQLAWTGKIQRLFVMASICGPWIRYENLALTAAACGLLLFKKRLPHAMAIGGAALVGLLAFSGFLVALGMPPVPSSIIAKSHIATDANLLGGILEALKFSFLSDRGVLLLLMTSVLVWFSVRPDLRATRPAAIGLAMAGLLHACFGAYGWYHRYECYIFAALLYGIFLLMAYPCGRMAERWSHASTTVLACFGLIVSFPYVADLFTVPLAASNIYEQQFQMHRFVTQWWKKPVAVNDLGWVAYQNDAYVLDLWGLGSHTALQARLEGRDPSWMSTLAEQHGVGLAIVYENWIPARAAGWIKVGELHLSRARITPASARVSFFATSPDNVDAIEMALVDFRKALPPGVMIVTRTSK